AVAQLLEALEEAAVDEDLRVAGVDQVARAGDRVGGAREGQLHRRCISEAGGNSPGLRCSHSAATGAGPRPTYWKNSLTRSIQPLCWGLCLGSFSEASSSRSSFFCW